MNEQTQNNNPAFLHQFTAGAILPLVQSLITAVIMFVVIFILAWIVFDALDPLKPAAIISVVTLLVTWLSRQKMWISLASLELMTGIDINQDGVIGEPIAQDGQDEKVSTVWIDLRKVGLKGSYSNSKFPLPKGVTEEHLAQIAHDMFILGKTFAETELSGTGRISLPKFRQLRGVMERQSLCEKTGTASNAPYELTDEGEAWLKQYLPSPTPSDDDL